VAPPTDPIIETLLAENLGKRYEIPDPPAPADPLLLLKGKMALE
jgi:hypothetical protein